MTGWNFAELWERIADRFRRCRRTGAGRPAHHRGGSSTVGRTAWRATCSTAERQHQDKVALYLYNAPEYMEGAFAAFKAGLVPVNTNYRYLDDELAYLWDNADAIAVVFHGCFAERIESIRERLPNVRHWLWVDDGSGPMPDWAESYEAAAAYRHRPGRRTVGALRRRHPHDLHRRHDRACPRASCGVRTT